MAALSIDYVAYRMYLYLFHLVSLTKKTHNYYRIDILTTSTTTVYKPIFPFNICYYKNSNVQ